MECFPRCSRQRGGVEELTLFLGVTTDFGMVEEMDKQDTGLREVKEETVARPSAHRETLKSMAEAKLETPKARRLLSEAEEVYRMFVESQGGSVS